MGICNAVSFELTRTGRNFAEGIFQFKKRQKPYSTPGTNAYLWDGVITDSRAGRGGALSRDLSDYSTIPPFRFYKVGSGARRYLSSLAPDSPFIFHIVWWRAMSAGENNINTSPGNFEKNSISQIWYVMMMTLTTDGRIFYRKIRGVSP